MDYPDYAEIRNKSRGLAFVWKAGDSLYYVGLFGALFIILIAPISWFFTRLKGSTVGPDLMNLPGLAALFISVATLFLGGYLKEWACKKSGVCE